MTISENQIRLLQANFIPDEMEERTEPLSGLQLIAVWSFAAVACWALAIGAGFCTYKAFQAIWG